MTVTVYKSTDAGAPTLNGNNGSLITVLDAVLVNGYGAKAAAGWTKPFAGTNQAAYRMNSVSGVGHYLQVNDNNPNTSANGKEARARGFVAMTSVTAGTEAFPTTTQVADTAGPMIRKSATLDATARPWIIVADERTFYLFIKSGDFTGWTAYMFGEYYSLKSGDAYRTAVIGRIASAAAGFALDTDDRLHALSAVSAVLTGHYTPRALGDVAGAVQFGKHGNSAHSVTELVGLCNYPNPIDGGMLLSQITMTFDLGSTCAVAGRLRGLWHFCHPIGAAVSDGDTFSGSGALAGKTFLVVSPSAVSTSLFVIETSDTWETN